MTEYSDDARQIRNEYARQWRRNNRDKVRTYNARYWMKKAEEIEGNSQEDAAAGIHSEE